MEKMFYGFRYYSNENTTWNNTSKIAGELIVFKHLKNLISWLDKENLYKPCGLNGGIRKRLSRKEALKIQGLKEFLFARENPNDN